MGSKNWQYFSSDLLASKIAILKIKVAVMESFREVVALKYLHTPWPGLVYGLIGI